jgi:hypothetical protein
MFIALKSLLRTLILPPAGPLLAALLGIWLARARSSPRAPCRVGARGSRVREPVAAVAAIGVEPSCAAAQLTPALDLTHPPQAQAIVILGGSSVTDEAPEYGDTPAPRGGLMERLAYGAFLARRTALPVLVSGTASEAEGMRVSLARDFGVQTRWVEGQSRDTFDNAQLSARMLRAHGVTRILLVTHAAHEWRASAEFASRACGRARPGARVDPPHHNLSSLLPNAGAAGIGRGGVQLVGDLARRAWSRSTCAGTPLKGALPKAHGRGRPQHRLPLARRATATNGSWCLLPWASMHHRAG